MTGKEKFNLRMQASGGSIRQEMIGSMQNAIDRLFEDDPSYRDDVTIWDTGIKIPVRIYGHSYRDAGMPRKQIQSPYHTPIAVGDIFSIGDEGYWICIESFLAHGMNYQGILEYCNYFLRFSQNGQILEYPVVVENATQYNDGEDTKPEMTLGNSKYVVKIPYDETTILVGRGKRFLIDRNHINPTAYRLTQVDSTSLAYGNKGVLKWTVVEDQFSSSRDNNKEMIADWEEKQPSYITSQCIIHFSGGAYLRLHQTKIFSATFQNEDGNALSLMPSWELIVEDDKREYFEIMEQNGELSITVTNVEYLQNTAVKIRCSDSSGTISAEVECKVVFGF